MSRPAGKPSCGGPATHRANQSQGDPSAEDAVIAHPVYGSLSWLAVVNPGPRTDQTVRELIITAHGLARGRAERRAETHP